MADADSDSDPDTNPRLRRRIVVFTLVVFFVVVLGFALGAFFTSQTGLTSTEAPDFETSEIVSEPIPSTGAPEPTSRTDGVMLIDDAHENRFAAEDIQPLVSAANRAGFEVRFLKSGPEEENESRLGGLAVGVGGGGDDAEESDPIGDELEEADAFVVIDPGSEYDPEEIEKVKEFVDRGGRMLIVSEPNRAEVVGLGRIETVRSKVTGIASAFGVNFGTAYVYNSVENDGNYRNVVATPPAESPLLLEADRAVFSTATYVEAPNGTDVLTAVEGTKRSDTRSEGNYTVAAKNEEGNVYAVGDKTVLGGSRHNIADNEVLVEDIVDFLAEGDTDAGAAVGGFGGFSP